MNQPLQSESSNITRHFAFRFMIGFWLLLGLIDLLKNLVYSANAGQTFDWSFSLQFVSIYSLAWILLSFPIYSLFRRTLDLGWPLRVISHTIGSMGFGALQTIITSLVFSYFLCESQDTAGIGFWQFYLEQISNRFFSSWLNGALAYWMVVIILLAFDYYDKFRKQSTLALQLESELSQAQLEALRMQVQPHFLFNAHNTIAMLIRGGKSEAAVDMISGLSDMLRTTLTQENEQVITLREEIDLVEKYLNIERARFEERLTVSIRIDKQTAKALVPSLILQPLVENAIKHGVAREMNDAEIEINSAKQNGTLAITVYNSGPALLPEWNIAKTDGIGLQNVTRRLQKLFPDASHLSLKNSRDGVEATLTIPFAIKG